MKILLSIFISMLIFVPLQGTTAEKITPPEIYYYDGYSFVIERADGSQPRVLIEVDVPGIVIGPGWSPSGQWFAWTSHEFVAPTYQSVGAVVDVSGNEHYSFVDDQTRFSQFQLSWSPTRDLLLVNEVSYERLADGSPHHFGDTEYRTFIFDPETRMTIIVTDQPLHDATWSRTGRFVLTYAPSDGAAYRALCLYAVDETRHSCRDVVGKVVLSTNDRLLAYLNQDSQPVIEYLAENATQVLDIPNNATVYPIAWSPDEDFLFLREVSESQSGEASIWMWQRSGITEFSSAQIEITAHAPRTVYDNAMSQWSHSSRFTAFPEPDESIAVFDMQTKELIDTYTETPLAQSAFVWEGDQLFVLANLTYDHAIVYMYDPFNNTRETLATQVGAEVPGFIAANSAGYVAFQDISMEQSISVLSYVSDEHYSFELVDAPSGSAGPLVGDIKLHSAAPWMFLTTFLTDVTSGGVYIVNIDGTYQRQIGYCPVGEMSKSCYGWAP